tara:strand:- start:9869 stop:10114 length:246 start_codon:yes stop_codon:yes gene_type:complete
MFDFISNAVGSVVNSTVNTVSNFVEDPVGTTVDVVTQPIVDGLDVLEGLSEGEIRAKAALRLGADVVASMAVSELIAVLSE